MKLGEKMEKILNWFKHQRKKEVRTGRMKFEVISLSIFILLRFFSLNLNFFIGKYSQFKSIFFISNKVIFLFVIFEFHRK